MGDRPKTGAWLPPKWFIHLAWRVHRGLYRITGGKKGLRTPSATSYGMFRLTTIGRRSGQERSVILGYFEDGANLVTMAMNGWDAPEPAWWLNLMKHPDAVVEVPGEIRNVRARSAEGEERARLWQRWREYDTNLDQYATRRPTETAVVVLEPRSADPGGA